MVAGMIRWPWPAIMLRKFEVKFTVRGIEGLAESEGKMIAEVRWKGSKRTTAFRSLRRGVKRNCTRVGEVEGGRGEVEWNEEFGSVVGLIENKESGFDPWEIEVLVFYVSLNHLDLR